MSCESCESDDGLFLILRTLGDLSNDAGDALIRFMNVTLMRDLRTNAVMDFWNAIKRNTLTPVLHTPLVSVEAQHNVCCQMGIHHCASLGCETQFASEVEVKAGHHMVAAAAQGKLLLSIEVG